jgi:hypothetical protein
METEKYSLRDALDFLEFLEGEAEQERAEQEATGVADNAYITSEASLRSYKVALNQLSGYLSADERMNLRNADWINAGIRLANARSIAPETVGSYIRRCKTIVSRLTLEYNY